MIENSYPDLTLCVPGFKLFSVDFVMHTTLYDHICFRFLAHIILLFSYIHISTNIIQLVVLTLSFSSNCCHKSHWKQLSWIYWMILPDIILGSERGHFWDTVYLEYSL